MRKFRLVFFAILLGIGFLSAQNKQLLYDFYEIPQALLLNPGVKTPYNWHAGVPILSGLSIQAGTSGITVNDLFANDGIDFTTKVRERAINSLNERDEFGGSGQIEVLYGGFRNANRPDTYYSFGMYGEGYIAQYWPKDLAILAFEGNGNNIGREFDLSDLTSGGEAVNVFHFGINKVVNNNLQVGFRGKLYSSVFNFRSVGNKGSFQTTEGENNILRNTLVADLQLQTSGPDLFLDILFDDTVQASEEFPKNFINRSFFGGDLGVGVDFGFTYQLSENTVLTGSILDLGFIYYSTDVRNFTFEGATSNEGIEIILPESFADINSDIYQNLIDEIGDEIPFETNSNSYFALRPIKLNASIRYNLGENGGRNCDCGTTAVRNNSSFDNKNTLGGQLYVINRLRGPQAALTAFYQTRIGNALAVKATYTADKYTLTNVGLGLNFQAGPVNFYLLGDNLFGYGNIPDSNYASLQFGFNIISWNSN